MSTAVQRRQTFVRYYKQQTGALEVNMREVAAFAKKMGWKLPTPPDPLDILAKQFSEAAGEEIRTDKESKRVYKANLAITERRSGKQMTFWVDVDDNPPRHRMLKGVHLYREQMVGEGLIGKNTVDHWNRNNPDQIPIPFDTDLTDDVNWRLNATIEERGGKSA